MSEKKVQVEIDGISYTLLTDEEESQIKEIAKYVEKKIDEIKTKKLSYDKELVLTSLNIANDLFNVGNKYTKLKKESEEAMNNYPSLSDNHAKLMEENSKLLAQIEQLQTKKKDLEAENTRLKRASMANEQANATIDKLRAEVKRLQQEAISLKAENEQFKESL